ncbi:uncharacterized protein METZ01_LOCUS517570, partial [marine metagenome]
GIWAEDCGTSVLQTGGNTITTTMNAIVTDGCDISDTNSSLIGAGGSGGTVWTIEIWADYFSPTNVTINEGDTVRWRNKEYAPGSAAPTYQHQVYSNATDTAAAGDLFDSTPLNLGESFTYTFDTAGTYGYYDYLHPLMYGFIIVNAGSSDDFTSTGLNVMGSNDQISLHGTTISGFTTGIDIIGGQLSLAGDAYVKGSNYGAKLDGTEVSSDGATVAADGDTGIGLSL